MRNTLLLVLAALTVGVSGTAFAASPEMSSVSGHVVDAVSHHPVGGAKIEIFTASTKSTNPLALAQTKSDGRFRAGGLAPGQYRIRILKMGYAVIELSGLQLQSNDQLIIGEPIGMVAASEEDMQKMACNSIVRPDAVGDVYVVCASR